MPHHPPLPWFDDGYIVALVELEEGTRLVTNLVGVDARRRVDRHAGRGALRGVRRRARAAAVHAGGAIVTARTHDARLARRSRRRRAARDGDRRDPDARRRRRDRVARLHAGAPRPRLREQPGRARHLHEHPLRHRLLQPVPHRLGRARRDDQASRDPSRRAGVPRPHAHLHRRGHGGRARRRRGHRRGRAARDERARRARRRHRDARPPARGERHDGRRAARAGPRSPASARPSSRRSRAAPSCSSRARPCRPRSTTPACRPPTSTGSSRSRWTPARRWRSRATSASASCRCSRACRTAAAPRPGTVMQAAMAVATGVADVVVCYRAFNERSGNRFGNMSARVDDAAAVAVVVRTVRADDAGGVGRAARPPLHGDVRRDQRRLRHDRGRRPRARRDEPRRVVLRTADHARRPPGVALDRRAGAAAARLLPGERRRRRAGRDVGRARPRPAPDRRR